MATQTSSQGGVTRFYDDSLQPFPANRVRSMWEDCPILESLHDPQYAHVYKNHFHTFAAGDWTITTTEAGAGDATEVITDELGGVLLVTNDDADNDSDEFQLVGEAFSMVPGKPIWLEGRFKISDATQSDFLFGLCILDTTLIDGMTDGAYFLKDDGDVNLDFHSEKNSNDTTGDTGYDVADATYMTLGLHVPSSGQEIQYWVDGTLRSTASTLANIPDDELLSLSFALQNGEAAAKTMSLDYLWAFQILNQ